MSDLLERDPEMQVIDEALRAARSGAGRLLLVEAPAGLGKSSLLEAARGRADDEGFEVLAARGRELERDFAFGVARQLFEARVHAGSASERRRLLQGSAGLAAELLGLEPPAGTQRPGDGSPYPLLHGLHWLAANLAERTPLLLVVDDAHWADELSLRFVVYLAARLDELPIAVMAALRPGEPGTDALLDQRAADPAARTLRPGPLSEAATGRLVAASAPGAELTFAAACHRATGGNPFLLRELLVALEREGVAPVAASVARVREIGPQPVSRAVELSLRGLAPEATAVARALAVLGDGAPLEAVAALARLAVDTAEPAAGSLRAAGILVDPGDGGIAFAHPILGRAIYEELDAGERAAAHRAAVRVLRAARAPAERVAAHALKAGGGTGPEVVGALRAAAAEAMRRGAPRPAAQYLRRALAEPHDPGDRARVLAELGRAEAAAGEPAAAERLREAMNTIGGGSEERATLAGELGNLLHAHGAFAEAAATFDRALHELGPGSTPMHQSLEAGWAAAALWTHTPAPEIRARAERFVDPRAEPVTRAERALVASLAALTMLSGDDREGAIACAQQAWGDGALLDRGVDEPGIWAVAATLAGSEAWDELAAVLDAVADAARRAGAVFAQATTGFLRAYRWMCLGAVDDALGEIDRALEARRHGWGAFVAAALWVRVRCLLERGDVAAAAATVRVPAEEDAQFSGSPLTLLMLDARALTLLAGNDAPAALACWREAGDLAAAMGVRNAGFVPWREGAALAAARLGEGGEARRLADAALAATRAHGAPRAIGVALTVRGTVERPPAALAWLEEAVTVLEATPARLDLARALVQLGTALRVAGRRTDARDPLRRGLDLADRCGGVVIAERAREELIAAGGRPRRTRMWGAEALTPSERRVAGLVASGMSNREAAEALFVTKKAVEFHLGNVYRKLRVSGRDELADALRDDR